MWIHDVGANAMDSMFHACDVEKVDEQTISFFQQNKLKSSQKDKVRQFMIFTQSNEKTALNCLAQNDWKLEVATDNFFQNPELYIQNLKGLFEKKKLELLYTRYRGKQITQETYDVSVARLSYLRVPKRLVAVETALL